MAAGGIVRVANGCDDRRRPRSSTSGLPRSRLAAHAGGRVLPRVPDRPHRLGQRQRPAHHLGRVRAVPARARRGRSAATRGTPSARTWSWWSGSTRTCASAARSTGSRSSPIRSAGRRRRRTLATLSRQRRRWQRGLGETLWRHRRQIGNPRYGAIGPRGAALLPALRVPRAATVEVARHRRRARRVAPRRRSRSSFFLAFLGRLDPLSIAALDRGDPARGVRGAPLRARQRHRPPRPLRAARELRLPAADAFWRCPASSISCAAARTGARCGGAGSSARAEAPLAVEQHDASRAGSPSALVVAAVAAGGCSASRVDGSSERRALRSSRTEVGELTLPARVEGRSVAAATADGFVPLFWAGVNLGSTVPGTSAGRGRRHARGLRPLAARAWATSASASSASTRSCARRSTTRSPPTTTTHADAPLFFIQGVWIPEEEFVATGNAYDPAVTEGFRAEIEDAVAVVHGDADAAGAPRPRRRRVRAATCRAGCSRSRSASSGTRTRSSRPTSINAGTSPYQGTYIRASPDATPMESWIASMLDYTADAATPSAAGAGR